MDMRIIAACGNDCAACPRHLPKSEEELRHTAELWAKIGYRDHVVSNAEIACAGCTPSNWCRYGIAECASARRVSTCGACPEYPCEKTRACLAGTVSFAPACKSACDAGEWNALQRAFFEKKRNLDMIHIRTIGTERLILRPLGAGDAEDAFEWQSDPEVNRYMIYPLYTDVEKTREWIMSLRPDANEFGFELKTTGKVIGAGGIKYHADGNAWELGYNLNRAYWGKGYATEASKALMQWAYETQGARNFTAAHATANVASGNVIRKCGFQFDRFGEYARIDGSETFEATFYKMHLD